MRTAYVDESEPGGGLDHTTYLMAAVIVSDTERDALRRSIEQVRPKRMKKLHWYEALRTQRISWLALLTHAVAILIVRYEGVAARAERRRRACIERLVWELELLGVQRIVLESRGRAGDLADGSMIDALRRRGSGRTVRYEHARGNDEPLLALADLACGAHRAGEDRQARSQVFIVQ